MLFVRSSTMLTATNQVTSVARKAMPAPAATGRRYDLSGFPRLAVIAESTRMHSSPSRNTRTPMFRICAREPDPGARGFGLPAEASACQINSPITRNAPGIRKIGKVRFLAGGVRSVVSRNMATPDYTYRTELVAVWECEIFV